MDIQTITMPQEAAQQAFEAYRASVKRSNDAADRLIMRGYKYLAQGNSILDLSQVMRTSGTQPYTRRQQKIEHLPKLLIVRADAQFCYFEKSGQGCCFGFEREFKIHHTNRCISLPEDTFPETPSYQTYKAIVPIIPPHLRPADALSNYYILSEAHWSPEPPRDPFLLKRIDGYLFAVLAAWDLTEIERAVLGAIRRPEM